MIVIGISKSCPESFYRTFKHITDIIGVNFAVSSVFDKCDIFITCQAENIPVIKDRGTVIVLDKDLPEDAALPPYQVITCGLSSKNTVTATSIDTCIDTYRFNYCLKETVHSLKGNPVNQQEIPVCIALDADCDITFVLASFTVLLLMETLYVINQRNSEY